jgi:hypothetical protein
MRRNVLCLKKEEEQDQSSFIKKLKKLRTLCQKEITSNALYRIMCT